jgi:hypothetical protein
LRTLIILDRAALVYSAECKLAVWRGSPLFPKGLRRREASSSVIIWGSFPKKNPLLAGNCFKVRTGRKGSVLRRKLHSLRRTKAAKEYLSWMKSTVKLTHL